MTEQIPDGVTAYFEVPVCGAPAQMLAELSLRRMIFKATAELDHAIRGRYALTYLPGSPTAVMHGFMNLSCAAAVLHFGGEMEEAVEVLEEEWPGAFQVTPEAIAWQQNSWNAGELREVRLKFFAGFVSCSFEGPMREMEALRWI